MQFDNQLVETFSEWVNRLFDGVTQSEAYLFLISFDVVLRIYNDSNYRSVIKYVYREDNRTPVNA